MTCKMCGFEFCWLCKGSWKDHNNTTGGYYKCNKFTEDAQKEDQTIENVKFELQRYMFFFERYQNHQKSEKLAIKLVQVMEHKMQQLHELKHYPQMELEYLSNAVTEVIRCRQVLKYTYVYAYYNPKMNNQSKNLFEHQQMLLEEACELLHE